MKKILRNKEGSAILWTILFTVVLTILLGAVMTASYTYYNYTAHTVKKQQAYFTARSAVEIILADISNQDDDTPSKLMPTKNNDVEISSFGFANNMGDATAKITYVDDENIKVTVTGTYQDVSHKIECTVSEQPVYFGGICLDTYTAGDTLSQLILDDNTDVYYRGGDESTVAPTFSTANFKTIGGNLVARGNIQVVTGTSISGHVFNQTVNFAKGTSQTKRLWNASEYVISNKTLKVDSTTSLNESLFDKLRSLIEGNYKFSYCNNRQATRNTFGGVAEGGFANLIEWLISSSAKDDYVTDSLKLSDFSTDQLGNRYLEIYSMTSILDRYNLTLPDWARQYLRTIKDVSFIDYDAAGLTTSMDNVSPIVYILVDDNLEVRMEFGYDPSNQNIFDWIQNMFQNITDSKAAYTIVYLSPGSTLELGANNAKNQFAGKGMDFYMSVYGDSTTKLVLDDGVKLYGSVDVGNVTVAPGASATISYATSTGSQIAKQQVDTYWTVSNYSD